MRRILSFILILSLLILPALGQQASQQALFGTPTSGGASGGPIVVAEGAAEIASTTNAQTYNFPSVTLSGNAVVVILAFVKVTTATGAINNVSGDALTWTKATNFAWPTGDNSHQAYIFWAKTPASPAASVYQIDVTTGTNATGCGAVMFQFTGADLVTANPIKQIAANDSGTGGGTNANGTFGAALGTNNGYAAGWMGALGSNSSAPPGSWTEIADAGFTGPTSNVSGAFRAGGETGTSVTFTNASTLWAFTAVEVYVEGAGP
jgi:hypothetical protein